MIALLALLACGASTPSSEDTSADTGVADASDSPPEDSADTSDESVDSSTNEASDVSEDPSDTEDPSDSAEPAVEAMPDFTLPDANASSATFGADISPRGLQGTVTAWYFTRGTCGYCRSQYVQLQAMQTQLAAEHPGLAIQILTVNMVASEAGLEDLAAGGDLPVLQDTVEVNATEAWGAAWRDVFVLDAQNRPVEVYNLTAHDLHDPANFAHLQDLLVRTATP